MRFLNTIGVAACALSSIASAASSWTFDDATLSVAAKGSEAVKHKYVHIQRAGQHISPLTMNPPDSHRVHLSQLLLSYQQQHLSNSFSQLKKARAGNDHIKPSSLSTKRAPA